MTQNKIIIGLTGGIACGKSSITSILKDLGAYIIDGDEIAKDITLNNQHAIDDIKNCFGHSIFDADGKLNRKLLSNLVFSDKIELEKLNSIMFNYIIAEVKKRLAEAKTIHNIKYIVIDGALLFEMGINKECDIICAVNCSRRTQIERIMKRNSIAYEDAVKRINSQIPTDELIKKCDYVIENNEIIDKLYNKTVDFLKYIDTNY